MKYLLSILCLFVLSCDSDDSSESDFLIPNSYDDSWTYRFTETIYTTTMTHDVVRTIIDPDLITFNYDNVCSAEEYYTTYIFSEGINFEEDFGWDCENRNENICNQLTDYSYIDYSSYVNSSEIFRFCSTIYESQEEQDDNGEGNNGPDIVSKVPFNPYVIFNIVNLNLPVYVGKTWVMDIEDITSFITYEVLSSEVLTLNIQNEPASFNVYKIGVFFDFINEMNVYLSSIGIIKIDYVSNDMPVTNESGETGETFNTSINIELIDYNID